jgi:heme-degrading monooxygenase HmoA
MPSFTPLDPQFPLQRQLELGASPVILINIFTLAPEDEPALLTAWSEDARFMKSQAGYISAQLHRAVGPSPTFLNYAVWESIDAFRSAFSNPEFQRKLANYPESVTVSPHLFRRVAVPGVCIGEVAAGEGASSVSQEMRIERAT